MCKYLVSIGYSCSPNEEDEARREIQNDSHTLRRQYLKWVKACDDPGAIGHTTQALVLRIAFVQFLNNPRQLG